MVRPVYLFFGVYYMVDTSFSVIELFTLLEYNKIYKIRIGEGGRRVKKLILGIAVMAIGAISTIFILVATILSPLNPYSYNGVGGWYGCLLGMDLVMPFTISIILAIIGLVIAAWGVFDKKN